MITFSLIRYGVFALIMFLDGLVGTFAALNLGYAAGIPGSVNAKPIDIYLISLALVVFLFIFPVLGIEISSKRPLTSRVWFELAWVAILGALHIAGAVAATVRLPNIFCRTLVARTTCNTGITLLAFIWANAFMLVGYFVLLFTMAILTRERSIWNQNVRDYAWFGTRQRGALHGLPGLNYDGSPHSSSESLVSIKEKGWDLYQQQKPTIEPSYEQFEAQLRYASSNVPREPDHFERVRLSVVEQYRMDHHPYHTAEPPCIQLPKPPAPIAASSLSKPMPPPPIARDWALQPSRLSMNVHPQELDPPGLSPVVFDGGEKVLVQPAPTRTKLPQLPQPSLYPQHVVNAGLTTNLAPPAPAPAIGGRRRRGTLSENQPDPLVSTGMRAPSPWENGGSVDSTAAVVGHASASAPVKPPKHRPPPLDLSAVSNLPGTERRRR